MFPVSSTFHTEIIPDDYNAFVYSEQSLMSAIVENGQCIAKMYLKTPGSKQFWIGTTSKEIVDVKIIGWTIDNYIIIYDSNTYYLPKIHFMELMNIQTKKEASQ